MIAWAEHEFRYGKPAGDGSSEGEHRESAERQLAKLPAALRPKRLAKVAPQPSGPDFPDALSYLWGWFVELSLGLAVNGMVYPRVTWEAIKAWREQMDVRVEPWEARALVELGSLRAAVLSEDAKKKPRGTTRPKT